MPPEATAGAAPISTGSTGTVVQPNVASTGGPSGVQNGGSPAVPGPVAVPNNASPADWTSSLNESQRLFVQNKGFKQPAEALESYRNLETLMGVPKERLLKLPEAPDAPEWGEVYDRLGRPKNANEYTFKEPEGVKGDPQFKDWAQKQFHALGLTKSQGETLAAKWNEYAQGDVAKQKETYAANLKVEQGALQKEWGAAYEQQIKTCFKAAQTFGLGQEDVTKLENALGYSATLKFLAKVGAKVGEDSFVMGDGAGSGFQGALTPERAQAEITELKKDKDFLRRYSSGDREAFKKMERLHQFAYPDLPQD